MVKVSKFWLFSVFTMKKVSVWHVWFTFRLIALLVTGENKLQFIIKPDLLDSFIKAHFHLPCGTLSEFKYCHMTIFGRPHWLEVTWSELINYYSILQPQTLSTHNVSYNYMPYLYQWKLQLLHIIYGITCTCNELQSTYNYM